MITRVKQFKRGSLAIASLLTLSVAILPVRASGFFQTRTEVPPDLSLTTPSIFDHLHQEQPLKITLETDLDELINNRRRTDYQEGRMVFTNAAGVEKERAIEIKPRGKYRRRVCDFPPVKISFKKRELQAEGLNPKYDDLKLVTHCLDDQEEGNANVFKEFLVYKLYALLTEKSYRVQLAEVTYVDSEGTLEKIKRYAFLIEDTDQLAQRLEGEECENCMNPMLSALSENDLALVSVFQFMIGNADWNFNMMRNLKLIKFEDKGKDILVPYDFDFSGVVNTSYAVPNVDYRMASTRQRIFLGPRLSDESLRWALDLVGSKKSAMLNLVDGFEFLTKPQREEMSSYLVSFFDYADEFTSDNKKGLYKKITKGKLDYPPEESTDSGAVYGQ